MVGARETELHAAPHLLGGLAVESGDPGTGLDADAAVQHHRAEACAMSRAPRLWPNLPSTLQSVGRDRGAVPLLPRGHPSSRAGTGCWTRGLGVGQQPLRGAASLGQWAEAAEDRRARSGSATAPKPRGMGALRLAHLALGRGDLAEAARRLATARARYGTRPDAPAVLPLARITLGIAAAGPDHRPRGPAPGLDAGFPPGTHRHGWPLLLAAATAEADARTLPAARPGQAEILDRLSAAVQ